MNNARQTYHGFRYNETYRQRHGFGGFPGLISRADCLMCQGTGHAGGNDDDPNECGFCTAPDEDGDEIKRLRDAAAKTFSILQGWWLDNTITAQQYSSALDAWPDDLYQRIFDLPQ